MRGIRDLLAENELDFRRPKELVFDVDESFRGLDGSELGLYDSEVAFRNGRVDMFGYGANNLHREVADGW